MWRPACPDFSSYACCRIAYRFLSILGKPMLHELTSRIALCIALGLVAGAGNLLGGYFVVYRQWPRKYLQYFLALGAGYMLAVSLIEVIPESLKLAGENALLYVLGGFFLVHLFEHILAQ